MSKYKDGARRQYHTVATIPNDIVGEWDTAVNDAENYISSCKNPPNAGKGATYHIIFEAGVHHLIEEMAKKGDGDAKLYTAINKRLHIENKKKARVRKLLHMCDEIGPIEFEKWARDIGTIDPEPILDQYRLGHAFDLQETWADKARRWLKSVMDDGSPRLSTDIRDIAVKDKLINDSDTDWSKLRTLASRYHYTVGKKGEWQLPLYNRLTVDV